MVLSKLPIPGHYRSDMKTAVKFLPLFLFGALTTASGAAVTSSSLAEWLSAGTSNPGLVAFTGISSNPTSSYGSNGFTFAGSSGNQVIGQPNTPTAGFYYLGTGGVLVGPNAPHSLIITIPASVYGLGLYVGTASGTGQTTRATINGNSSAFYDFATQALPTSAPTFWGIRSDVPITSIALSGLVGERIVIDSVRWSDDALVVASETPEGSTLALIGIGLLVLWMASPSIAPRRRAA